MGKTHTGMGKPHNGKWAALIDRIIGQPSNQGRLSLSWLWRWSTWKIVLLLILITGMLCGGILWHLKQAREALVLGTAQHYAERYAQAITELRGLYTSEVVEYATRQGMEARHDYHDVNNAIPLPATLTIMLGERISARNTGVRVSLYSPYPFPWRAQRRRLQYFEWDAWNALKAHPEQSFSRVEKVDNEWMLRYATADRMLPQCLQCHNAHPDSPKRDWQTGDVRGVLEIDMPISEDLLGVSNSLQQTSRVLFGVAAIAILAIAAMLVQQRLRADLHKQLARTDSLTNLLNRRAFEEALDYEWRRGKRQGRPLSLLIIDVDNFKAYNDRYGHMAGDECLCLVANALSLSAQRVNDIVSRYGGEEFVILLPETTGNEAMKVAEATCLRVRELKIPHERNGTRNIVTISVGVVTRVPQAETGADVLLQVADRALYLAKSRGRDGVVMGE